MDYDPLSEVIDEPLSINSSILDELRAFRGTEKLENLPGTNTAAEKARLSNVLNDLLDRLLRGVEAHPSKLWVLTEFQKALVLVEGEDTEGREHFGMEMENIMDILSIDSSDGLLTAYLGGI
ncbi:DUF4844 domain-containing protein [Pseudoduganella violacea]|uniref:DUF4844 domain-containing protein n=1 Tax=Pseudoduganella violacea TaxID=1715466 RepID=A0A7W5FWX9_9BURK|nr:DUF4844 domain-containing protein [Pseudoduganella violacea]MBB3122510.1 hypothetical protein [Pseudoduganella violacea]